MAQSIRAYAAHQKGGPLEPYTYEPGPLGAEQVEIAVESCGVCHSDLSVLDGDWGEPALPLVPGHEVVGTVAAVGSEVKNVKAGQRVGLGWFSGSCMGCQACLHGDQNFCPSVESTIMGRPGGFAERVRCHWAWAIPLPDGLDAASAGPLFCGGITVFNPFVQFSVKPTDRVGVVGIGGLGHLALQFANKWGCEVVAFTSSPNKADEARGLGAHHVVNSRDPEDMKAVAGSLDFVLSTVNVALDWPALLGTLAPKGRLHTVGVVPEPIPVSAFPAIVGQQSVSGSPLGSPSTTATMLEFCARHGIAPVTETFPLSRVNEALERLRSGKARYRVVVTNDFGAA